MALTVNRSAAWDVLVQWAQGQPDKAAYKCVKDVQTLSEWKNGTDIVSQIWQLFTTQGPLNTADQKFAELKRKLLGYLETAPSGNSISIGQLQDIQTEIEQNTTLVEMWICTKKYYFVQARHNRTHPEFPDYVFGFTYFGTLAERVKKIKDQINELNRPRSQAFVTTSCWLLRNTSLTHAFMPQIISKEFTNITFLDMSYNQFETMGDFSRLSKLTILLLTGNRLQKIAAAHLPLSLELLDLDKNQFTIQPNLARLTRLESLDLSDNQLAAISSRLLPPNLESLYIQRNPLPSIDHVQTAFPDLEITSNVNSSAKRKREPEA